jgi:hypothetical protein
MQRGDEETRRRDGSGDRGELDSVEDEASSSAIGEVVVVCSAATRKHGAEKALAIVASWDLRMRASPARRK